MKKYRVLVLTAKGLLPPEKVNESEIETAEWKMEYDIIDTLKFLKHEVIPVEVDEDLSIVKKSIEEHKPHIIFMLLEWFRGISTYDYNLVSYLELLNIPYTGCNSRGLMLTKDKALSKTVLKHHRIPVPQFFTCKRNHKPKMPKTMGYPCIVKSLVEDASRGISQASVVKNYNELKARVEFVHKNIQTDAIIEQYIDGRELYVGVLGNHRLKVLPVWELKFDKVHGNFVRIATSRVKWNEEYRKSNKIRTGKAVRLPNDIVKQLQALSKRAYRRLDLNGYARLDYRLTDDGKIYLIEVNPNPSIAYGDEFPDSAKEAGMTYEELIMKIISLGLSWQ